MNNRGGWWRTGDLARRDDEEFIWIAGRVKDLVKSSAESIYPIEVVFNESLPRGTTSKVSKEALRTLWAARAASR